MALTFRPFEKANRRKHAIADLEAALEVKTSEEAASAGALRDKLTVVRNDTARLPIAGALTWRWKGSD